jgi:hypothetical protein
MSRGGGKHSQRTPEIPHVDPDSPKGHQLGMSVRTQGVPSPIPGGKEHIQNAPTFRQKVPVADSKPEITDLNAHGVPPGSATSRERAEIMRGPNSVHQRNAQPPPARRERPAPIPVNIVQDDRPQVIRAAFPHTFIVPANTGADAVRICGRDPSRKYVMILNESTAHNIRIGQRVADLNNGGGALIPWPGNSYVRIDTQDELYALSADSSSAQVSVIQVAERGMG